MRSVVPRSIAGWVVLALSAGAAVAELPADLPRHLRLGMSHGSFSEPPMRFVDVRWCDGKGYIEKSVWDPRAKSPVRRDLDAGTVRALWSVCRTTQPWAAVRATPTHTSSTRGLSFAARAGDQVLLSRPLDWPGAVPAADPLAPLVAHLERLAGAMPEVEIAPSQPPAPGLPAELTIELATRGREQRKLKVTLVAGEAQVSKEFDAGNHGGGSSAGSLSTSDLLELWAGLQQAKFFDISRASERSLDPAAHAVLSVTALQSGKTRRGVLAIENEGHRANALRPVLEALARHDPELFRTPVGGVRMTALAGPGGRPSPHGPARGPGAGAGAPANPPSGGTTVGAGPEARPPESAGVPDFSLELEAPGNPDLAPAHRPKLTASWNCSTGLGSASGRVQWPDGQGAGGGGPAGTGRHAKDFWTAIERAGLPGSKSRALPAHPVQLKLAIQGAAPKTVALSWPSLAAVPARLRPLVDELVREPAILFLLPYRP